MKSPSIVVRGVVWWLAAGCLAAALLEPSPDPVSAQAQPPSRSQPQPQPQPQPDYPFVPGRLLVKFRPGTSSALAQDVHRRVGAAPIDVIPGLGIEIVRVPRGAEALFLGRYLSNRSVEFAEVDGFYRVLGGAPATFVPDDAQVGEQWQYHNTGQTGGTPDADIDAFDAWDITRGRATVAIAILDTGLDRSHEDLAPKIVKNVNFTDSPTTNDKYGHGTHVAGSAAAVTDNGIGVAGTCPNCVLFNVKVLGDGGWGLWSWVARGITWAADQGARVVSMSLGSDEGSKSVRTAVNYAWNKGVLLVAAAGNDGTRAKTYPAAYEVVIAVAATDDEDQKANFSNWDDAWVDVAAPGVRILSTAPDHRSVIWGPAAMYGTLSGTSMATPHVAGVAGLVWSRGICGQSAVCVRDRIESHADPIPGTGAFWKYGRINARKSVN